MKIPASLRLWALLIGLLTPLLSCETASDVSVKGGGMDSGGKAGSMARFAVMGNTLYTIDDQSLHVFDLSTPTAPAPVTVAQLGVGIETLFPQAPYLFVGTQRGMYIFDVSNPQAPRQLSFYQHVVSCDPVVVDGRYAYLTLRAGRTCGGGTNELQVIDLQDLTRPRLAQSYPMTKPYGLGVDSSALFVCDAGLRVFDTRQTPTLTQRAHYPIEAYDVIPDQGRLLVIGNAGLYQYAYTPGSTALTQLSFLPITPRP